MSPANYWETSFSSARRNKNLDANEKDNSKEFFIAVKYEADLEIKG